MNSINQPQKTASPTAHDDEPGAGSDPTIDDTRPLVSNPRDERFDPASGIGTEPLPALDEPPSEPASADEKPWWEETDGAANEPAQSTHAPEENPVPEPIRVPEDDETRALNTNAAPMITVVRSATGLVATAMRDVGRVRSINQDSAFALITALPRESMDVQMGLFVVADGMGGHDGGEIASRMAVSAVVRTVLADLLVPALDDEVSAAMQSMVVSAVQQANREIWEHARSIGSDMGTTCTSALLLGHTLYLGHVGDSRAYLHTPGALRPLTADHSAVGRLIQLGQLDPSEAREHPLRSHLYRAIGQQPETVVDFIYEPIENARHLILCSDGLWSMIDEDDMLDVLEHTTWPHDACRELIARANLAGGEDNISVVVVSFPHSQA
jgi:serine/threonine protein phosphatase PrpC